MADISYNPSFHDFLDYVDGQDLVRAEGQGGLNAWLAAIESDLAQLSTVVTAIDTRLDQLESPPPVTQRLVQPLRLLATGPNASWGYDGGGLNVSPGVSATGVLNVAVPDGVRLVSLRATGSAVGVSVVVSLTRTRIDGGGTPQVLASVTGSTTPFDVKATIDDHDLALVDTATFTYRVKATAGPSAGFAVTTFITGMQITVAG